VPADSVETVRVAVPLVRLALPSLVEPSMKSTLPVAVEGDTVAVSFTFWPKFAGLRDETNLVVEVGVVANPFRPCTADSSTTAARATERKWLSTALVS